MRTSLEFFRMNEPVWGTCLNFLLMGMAIAVLWLWDRGGYCCSVGVNYYLIGSREQRLAIKLNQKMGVR